MMSIEAVTFARPQLIVLLAIPVILLFWEWTRKGQPLVLPFDNAERGGKGRWIATLVLMANSLPALLLAVAIVLLARPIVHAAPKTERQLSNIQIVLDCSLSMREEYGIQQGGEPYTRFDAAVDSIDSFITARSGDAFGLTIFSKNFLHWVPLTQDVSAIRMARDFIAPENFPDPIWGGTFVSKALDGAISPLSKRGDGDRMIVLITDGESRDLSGQPLRDIVMKLKQANIMVYAISMTDSPIAPGLIEVTRETGGEVFQALTPQSLQIVFDSIDEMKKVEVKAVKPEVIDYFDPFLLPAFGLCLLQIAVLFGLRFTPW